MLHGKQPTLCVSNVADEHIYHLRSAPQHKRAITGNYRRRIA